MKTNIFENAKFGDKFITNNGEIALFISRSTTNDHPYLQVALLYTQYDGIQSFNLQGQWVNEDDGTICSTDTDNRHDIKEMYQEPISEQELQKIAEEYCEDKNTSKYYNKEYPINIAYKAFIAGYKKAKENN